MEFLCMGLVSLYRCDLQVYFFALVNWEVFSFSAVLHQSHLQNSRTIDWNILLSELLT